MELATLAIIALGALVFAAVLVRWLADARRARQVDDDPERSQVEQASDEEGPLPGTLPGWRGPLF